jgi:hypothetical protein
MAGGARLLHCHWALAALMSVPIEMSLFAAPAAQAMSITVAALSLQQSLTAACFSHFNVYWCSLQTDILDDIWQ